jgi:transposase
MSSRHKKPGSSNSKRERRSFSLEFKREAVRLLEERRRAGISLAQIGRELDVRPDQLRVWAEQLGDASSEDADSVTSDAAEIRRLRRELETVRQERDFLKKAAAFFAKESR